jgi:hypothetical protein
MATSVVYLCGCDVSAQVMEHTPHIFLSGPEAEDFAVQQGMQLVDNASFTTQQRKEQWQRYASEQRLAPADEIVQKIGPAAAAAAPEAAAADSCKQHCQTVGAVAIDSQGRLAAGGLLCWRSIMQSKLPPDQSTAACGLHTAVRIKPRTLLQRDSNSSSRLLMSSGPYNMQCSASAWV